MAAKDAAGRVRGKLPRKQRSPAEIKLKAKLPIGRPVRLAHLTPGHDRQLRRERAQQASVITPPPRPSDDPAAFAPEPPQSGLSNDVLCLPNPEWLPHVLTVSGPHAQLGAFRLSAAGPGSIPWLADYDRLEEDWINAMLTPAPADRGISVEGARILARQLRERVEAQDQRAAEIAVGDGLCPLDLNALIPIPGRLLRLTPDDPVVVTWLWEHWGTSWALRGVEEIPGVPEQPLPAGHACIGYRFWSADWTPWRVLSSVGSRFPSIRFHVSVRAVSE